MPELCAPHLPLLLHGIVVSFFWGKSRCCWKNGVCEQIIKQHDTVFFEHRRYGFGFFFSFGLFSFSFLLHYLSLLLNILHSEYFLRTMSETLNSDTQLMFFCSSRTKISSPNVPLPTTISTLILDGRPAE